MADNSWSHLFLRDTRTAEERKAAESKEWKRRGGNARSRRHACGPPSLDWPEDDDAELRQFLERDR